MWVLGLWLTRQGLYQQSHLLRAPSPFEDSSLADFKPPVVKDAFGILIPLLHVHVMGL